MIFTPSNTPVTVSSSHPPTSLLEGRTSTAALPILEKPENMVILQILLVLFLRNVYSEETFKSMGCSNPSVIQVLAYNKCYFHPEQTSGSLVSLLQKIHMRKFTGYGCSLEISTNVGYFGAYSHTKEFGYSTYAKTHPLSPEECLRIVNQGTYTDSGVDVKVNAITSYNLITYRLLDAKNMANTLVYKHYIFKVHTVQLIDEYGVTILPTLQVELAPTKEQKGYHPSMRLRLNVCRRFFHYQKTTEF